VAVEEGFRANSTSIEAIAIDSHSIMVYSKYIIKIEVTNSFGECRVSNVDFIATNIKRYDVILG
jgi:hypothetical protein